MGTMFPIMLGLGLSAASAAGVIATSLGVAYTPTAIDAIRGSEAVNMDVVEYVVYHQGPAALATVLIVGISHFFWQKHCDRKAGTLPHEIGTTTVIKAGSTPAYYALLPMLPILSLPLAHRRFLSPELISISLRLFLSQWQFAC